MAQVIKFKYFILALIFLIALILRLHGIYLGNFSFTYDLGRDVLAVRTMLDNYDFSLIGPTTGIKGVFYGPWWYWFLTVISLFFSGDVQKMAYFFAILGALLCLSVYIFGIVITGNKKGSSPLFFAALIAFSPTMIGTSSQIWNPNMVPILICLWLLFIYFLIKDRQIALFFIAILSTLMIETEAAFGVFFVVAQTVTVLLFFRKQINLKRILYCIGGFMIIIWPRIIFDLRHSFLMSRNIVAFFRQPEGAKTDLLSRFIDRSLDFFYLWTQTFSNENIILGGLLILGIVIVLVKYYRFFNNSSKTLIKILISIIVLMYLQFSLYPGDFWQYYLIGLPVLYGAVFFLAYSVLEGRVRAKKFLLLPILYLLFLLQPIKHIKGIAGDNWEGDAAVYRNVRQAVETVYRDADGQEFNYIVYTPPVIPYTYQYLFVWLADTKYHNYPQAENRKLLYVLIEPEYEHPEFQERWLALHESDGKIVAHQKLRGGILLQKRERAGF